MERRTFINLGLTGLGTTLAMANSVPAQFIPKPSKEKWAVLFGTWYGTARDASVWISEGMGGSRLCLIFVRFRRISVLTTT